MSAKSPGSGGPGSGRRPRLCWWPSPDRVDMVDILDIRSAPHGQTVVIEKAGEVYVGRFDSTNGFQVFLHDAALRKLAPGAARDAWLAEVATYGVPVDERDLVLAADGILRVRLLREVARP